jgi:hypothetical protein
VAAILDTILARWRVFSDIVAGLQYGCFKSWRDWLHFLIIARWWKG